MSDVTARLTSHAVYTPRMANEGAAGRPTRHYARRYRRTLSRTNNLVQAVAGIVSVSVTLLAWWQFGPAWGLAALLACLLFVSVATGIDGEAELHAVRAEIAAPAAQPLQVTLTPDELRRQLLANADELSAIQADALRVREFHSMRRLDELLREGDELFAKLRADAPKDDPMTKAESKALNVRRDDGGGQLWAWQRKVLDVAGPLFPDVASYEKILLPIGGTMKAHRSGEPPPTWTTFELVDNAVSQFEAWAEPWKQRMDDFWDTAEPRKLPPWRRRN